MTALTVDGDGGLIQAERSFTAESCIMSRPQRSIAAATAYLTLGILLSLGAKPAAANFVFGLHVTNPHDPDPQLFDFSGDGFISLPQLIPGSDPARYDPNDVKFQFTATIQDADPNTFEPFVTTHIFTQADLDLGTTKTGLNWTINDIGGLPNLAMLSLYTKLGTATANTPFFGLTLQYDERAIFDPCSENSPLGQATGKACKIFLTEGEGGPSNFQYVGNFTQPNVIPLPGTVWLLVPGLVALAAFKSRSRRQPTFAAPKFTS